MDKKERSKKLKESKSKSNRYKKRDNSDKDSSEGEEWVESTAAEVSKHLKPLPERDAWMDIDILIPTTTRDEMRKKKKEILKDEKKSLSTLDKPGQHSRELNPYWKDGGIGLPSEDTNKNKNVPSVGDSGLNWLRKAYKRVFEQAKEEGKSPESVAAERWGSLENLEGLISKAEGKRKNPESSGRSGTGQSDHYNRSKGDHSRDRDVHHRQKRNDLNRRDMDDQQRSYNRSDRTDYGDKQRKYESSRDNESDRRRGYTKSFQKPGDSHKEYEWKPRKYDKPQSRWMKKSVDKEQHESKGNVLQVSPREKEEPVKVEKPKAENPQPKALSEKELNVLGAKILKAELMGNTDLVVKLKEQMSLALKAKEMGLQADDGPNSGGSKQEVIVLTQSNARGMTRPLPNEGGPSDGRRKKIKVATHDRDGNRARYFHDDEKYSLKEMFEREKFTTADDETALFLKMAAKNRPKTNEDYDIDDVFIDKAARGGSSSKDLERSRQQAIREHKSASFVTENCYQCLDSRNSQKHLIIAFGKKSYLCLPYHESLTDGHCFIVPMTHIPSATLLDEDVWSEIQDFRKALTLMYQDRGQDTVFMETSMNLRHHPHMIIECVPLEQETGMMAPMYFKKAILESETEWAQNVKLVDLSKKDIRHSVPKGLPYFSVDFGLQGGFAHVIEDEREFPVYFGKEILGGMLDIEPRLWMKPQKQKFDNQRKKVLQFNEWWKPYDFTLKLVSEGSDSN